MSTDYDRKFDEMKKYIPFLESMIKRLESTTSTTSSNPRLAQLDKIRSLRDLLLDKKKRMKMENLLKCEQVLINLYAKVEQRDSLPGIKKKSDNIFDVESPTPKEKTDLDSVRNKLKAVTKLQEEGTLPEIARANQIEENTVGKEPALFQRRPNKSPIGHLSSKNLNDEISPQYNNQTSRRNYTRVLVSPDSSPSRRQSTADSQNKLLFKRRSPRKSLRDYSPSYHRRDRKKSFKRDQSSQKVTDLNITLNVPEDSLHSLNTEDILSRIINCSDGDVDIDTLRELRSQILGELKETGTNNDISDLLLKSCSNKKKKSISKKRVEVEEGEISDSESEAIESIYGSLVVVDKDIKPANESKISEKGEEARRKIQICLVINSDKISSGTTQPENIDLELLDKDHKSLSRAKDKEVSTSETLVKDTTNNTTTVQSDFGTNELVNSELVQLDSLSSKRSSSQPLSADAKVNQDTFTSLEKSCKNTLNSETEKQITCDKKVTLNQNENKNDSTDSKNISNSLQNTGQFKANFYKPLNDEESLEKNKINSHEKTDAMLNIQLDKDNNVDFTTSSVPITIEVESTSSEPTTTELQRILDTNKNVDIPLLNEPSIPSKPIEKTTVSEIDILQALKNEILSEPIAIPCSETVTPPLHQPKLTKVASAKEIMPKKRISIEKYKEKSVNTTVKNMLRKESNSNTSLSKVDSIKTTKIKLTEKECERFNLPSRLSLDEQLSSDDEDEYNSDVLVEDVYGDLAPRSPDDTSLKEMDISPPVIIPIDPVKEAVIAPKSDVDMRTLPAIISPNPSIESNSSSVTQERGKDTKNDISQIQSKSATNNDTKKLPLDPRIRKDINKKDSPNPNFNPERMLRLTPFSNPSMTPILTPNSRSYEMTPTHHSFEVDIAPNRKHVYAPFASSFDVYDKREHSLSRENNWEEKKNEDKERDPKSKYLRESYQTKRNDETNYRKAPKIERYKIDRREDFRPEHSSTPSPAFGRQPDNSASFCRLNAPSTPVVGFGRSDSVTTPSHPFGRSDCPSTPSHHFGRSDCPSTPSHPFGRSDCPQTPSHSFGRNDCPTTPSHPFGRSDCPTTPSHPFGRSDCPTATSYHFGRSDCPSTPSHPFGRSDGSLTPSHPFGRNDFSMTPSHTFGRSECPTTPNHPFGRSEFHLTSNRQHLLKDPRCRGSEYDEDRDSSKYKDRSYDRNNAYTHQNRYRDSDSRYYQIDGRMDREESSRYAHQGRNYNRDKRFEYQGASQRIRDSENISGNNRERNGGYNDNSNSYEDFRSTHKSREESFSRSIRDDPRSRQRANSVGRNVYNDTQQSKMLSVEPEAGRSFKIDTSVNTTFQNFMDSKGLQMFSQSFDARRSRAASVGRSMQRESSVGRVLTPKPLSQDVTYKLCKNERYRRASSVGRDLINTKPEKSLKDLKAEFEAFKSKINDQEQKPTTASTDNKIDRCEEFQRCRSRFPSTAASSNDRNKNAKLSYSPRKNARDPRVHRERQDSYKNNNKHAIVGEPSEKKVPGIVYSSDNIAKGTVLRSGSGVKNYKIPKLRSVIEEKEREEKLKREKEEEERKEKERRQKEQKEKLVREKKEQEEKEKKEKEQKLRLEREATEKKEKLERERKGRMEKEEKERLERVRKEEYERLERVKKDKLEKERIEKEKIETMAREKREEADKDRKEKEERERKAKEEHERKVVQYRQRIEQKQECNDNEELESKDKEKNKQKANEERQPLKVNLKDEQENKMNKSDKEQLDQLNIAHKNKLTDDENNDLDSPTKRITRSRARMANLDSSDEIKPKKLTKSLVFDSDSDIEDNVSLKNEASTMVKSKKPDVTSPIKKKKSVDNKQVDFQSTFEVDELEMFGDNIASDPVIENLNDLIADLDNDIDTTKTDSTDNFKNEISLENMLENITSSQERTSKDLTKNFLNNSLDSKISESGGNNEDNIKKDNAEHAKDVIINTEHIVSTSEIPGSDIKKFEKSKIDAQLDDKSNDGCSTPDSTIFSDATLEKQKELSTVKDYSNESNSDVTSTLDTIESSYKDNVEPSSSRKDASSLSSIGSLLSILQDKTKIKELLTMLGESDNEKIKKKLEKLSELVSDDEDTNDGTGDKEKCSLQNESQIDNRIQNNASCEQKEENNKTDLDNSINNSTSYSIDKSITEVRSKEVSLIKIDENKNKECILNKEDQSITGENNIEKKSKSPAIANEHLEDMTNNLAENDSAQDAEDKKTGKLKKNKTLKRSKGKFVKKSVPKQTKAAKVQNDKPKRKTRNELQKLQEDIQEMFLSDDILNSTGIRMCRLAKLVDKKNADQKEDVVFQDPKPVVVLNKYLDLDKVEATQPVKIKNKPGPKLKHKSPVDTLKDKPKNVMHKPGPKSKTKSLRKEESDPYAFETDSVSESTKTRDSDSESETSESENCSLASSSKSFGSNDVLTDVKKKRRKRFAWQTGVIRPKHAKKRVEQKQVDHIEEELVLPQRDIAIPDPNCFVDKLYCFQKNLETYSCRLCVYTGTDIILHYKQKHPHTEIPLSRFNPKSAKEAIDQSENINFQAFSKVPSRSYTCRFCYKEFTKSKAVLETFFWHVVSMHTGEYKQACSECTDSSQCPFNLDIPPSPKDIKGQLIGYICEKCNFTQISLENLKTHVIVRHHDQQTVVYTINLSAMSKKKLATFIRRCNSSSPRTLRSTRNANQSTAEASDDQSDAAESESDTQTKSKKHLFSSPTKPKSPSSITNFQQIQSKITFESEDTNTNTDQDNFSVKIEEEQLNISNETVDYNESEEPDTALEDSVTSRTEENDDGRFSSDITAIAHFKVSYTNTGSMEYVCCINGNDHFRTTKLISLKQHARKQHTEKWDGYCIICKVIVTPQGVHKFSDCLQHFIDIHMGEFPIMERVNTLEADQTLSTSVEPPAPPKPYINVRPLSDLISKPVEEILPDHSSPSPVIESVVSLTQTVEPPRPSPNYPSTSLEKISSKAMKYEEWQASVMSKKHRVVLGTMMSKENLIKVFKCAARFCSFTSDNAEEALLHASTHQRIGGEGAMNCAYCDFDTSNNAIDLVMHVFKMHGRCQYSCALCFYRAVAGQLVGAHIDSAHPNCTAEGNVLRTTCITSAVPEDSNVLPREKAVKHYVCAQDTGYSKSFPLRCTFRTYTPGKFCEHLAKNHKPPFVCADCKESVATAADLIIHMKEHGLMLYQCTWCVHGAEKEADLISHVATNHPDKQPQAYIRIITNKDGSTEFRVLPLAYLNKTKVPVEDVTPSKSDDPVREANRSLELEKLIGQTILLSANTRRSTEQESNENDSQSLCMVNEQPDTLRSPAPIEPIGVRSGLQSVASSPLLESTPLLTASLGNDSLQTLHSSASLPSSSIQSTTVQPIKSSTSLSTNIITPSLSISTTTLSTQTNEVTPVIKIEPLETPNSITDVVLSDSDEEILKSDDVISISDDESEPVNDNEIIPETLLKCPRCKAEYTSIPTFTKHVITNGHAVGAINCPHSPCNRSVNSLNELLIHYDKDHDTLKTMAGKQRYNCALCGAYYDKSSSIRGHMNSVHKVTKMSCTTEKPGIFIVSDFKGTSESAKNTANNNSASQSQSSSDTDALFSIVETISSVQPKLVSSPQLATITPVQSLPTVPTSSSVTTSVTTTMTPLDVQSNQKTQGEVESQPFVSKIETIPAGNVLVSGSDEDPKNDVIDLSDDESVNAQTTVLLSQLMKCPTCHKAFRTTTGLDKHITYTNHSKFPVQCPHAPCTKIVNDLLELRIHYHSDHMDTKTPVSFIFNCTSCKTTSIKLDEIKYHMATFHGLNKVQVKASKKKGVYDVQEKTPAIPTKKTTKESVKDVYGPEEIDSLPIKPILDKSVRCSLCKFNTKVRLNMVRHLQLHLNQQQVPQTAPVNPVPHLETNEKHFDKMLNLASSSIMTRPDKQTKPDNPPTVAVMIPPEVAAKYPKYVPERQRLTCGAKGCSYISVDEAMLKCHWDTLHSGTSDYHCVHCPPYQQLDTTRALTAPLVITHLKMHDVTLYACSSCAYYHYLKNIVEKHISESHNGGNVLVVREEAPSAAPAPAPPAPTMDLKPWQCGLCKFKSMLHPNIVEHCFKQHNSKMQFKCNYCPFRTSTLENVTKHQTNSHSGKAEDVFYYYYREGLIPNDPDGTPRWVKQKQKMPEQVVKTEAPDETPSASSDPPLGPVISSTQMTVDLNKVKKEIEEKSDVEVSIEELCKRYGEFCEPNGLKYKCSLCKVVCVDTKEAMESHLYEELQYRKWGCNLCSYKAFHLTGLNEHMAAEHRLTKLQNAIKLPADINLERWVQAYLDHQDKFIENSRKSLNELKQAAAKAAASVAPPKKQPEPEQCQYSNEDLIKAFGGFGEASEGKYCCPKCDFVSTEYDMIKVHLEEELGKIRWTCSTCSENFLTYHQAQYHCKSAHPTVHSRPNPAARQQDMRSAWINAVINTQKESMTGSDVDKSDMADQSDNSLLVVRYEESVTDQEHAQHKRKRESSDSEDDTLVIDEPEPKKRTSKMRRCRFCNYLGQNNYQVYYHELRHFNLYPLTCSYCKFSGIKQQMLNHLRSIHGSLPISYKQTEVPNESPKNLPLKKRSKQDYMICLHCERNVPASETKAHVHENVKTEFASLGTYVMQCSICSLLCMNMSSLSEHHNATHPDIPMNYALYEMGVTKESVHCNVCNKRFKYRKDLYTHQRTEHEPYNATSVVGDTSEAPSPKRVARKSTSKLPKENAVAKKSTTKLPYSLENEEYSYYGTKPSMNEYENVTTMMPFCNTVMSFTMKKLNEIININPKVVVSDVTKKLKNVQ